MTERNAINVLIKLLGGKEMEAELQKLGKGGEAAFKEISDAANKVNFAKLGGALNQFGSSLATVAKRVTVGFAGVHAAVTAAAPVVMLMAKSGADAAEQAGRAAAAAGMQADAYQKLQFGAQATEVSQEQLNRAMSAFSREVVQAADNAAKGGQTIGRNIKQGMGFTTEAFEASGVSVTRFGDKVTGAADKAKKGAGQTRTAFEQLGISLRNADGTLKSNEQLLRQVADAFAKMPDGARKSAIATMLFAEAGADLIPLLNEGSAGLDRYGDAAEKLGAIFSGEQIRAAQDFNNALFEMKKTFGSLLRQIGLIFAPSIASGANAFRDLIVRNRKAILDFVDKGLKYATVMIKDFFAVLAGRDSDVQSNQWLIAWRDAIIQFGSDFVAVVNGVLVPSFEQLHNAIRLVTDALNGIFGTDFTAGQALLMASLVQLVGGFRLLWSTIGLAVAAARVLFALAFTNPWTAAIAVVALGLTRWATNADTATAAMEKHRGVVDSVSEAYDRVGRKIDAMAQKERDRKLLDARGPQETLARQFEAQMATMRTQLKQMMVLADESNPFAKIMQDFIDKKSSLDDFSAAVVQIGKVSPEFDVAAQRLLGMSDAVTDLGKEVQKGQNWIDLLNGSINDSEFATRQAALGVAGYADAVKSGAAAAAGSMEKVGAAADSTSGKVENLNRTITVTKFGAEGPVKQAFELVNGVARAVDQSKTQLDALNQSTLQAATNIAGVASEVSHAVRSVPEGLKSDAATVAVDSVIADVDRIAPAAEAAAGDVNVALSDIGKVDATGAQAAAQAIMSPFEGLSAKIDQIMVAIRAAAQSGFGALVSVVQQLASQIEATIARIIAALQRAAAEAARLKAAAGSSSSGSSARVSPRNGFASGGSVRGPGTATSDSIFARLSNGEFVIQAAAVRKFGIGFFDMLNRGLLPAFKGFSVGGFVDGLNRSLAIPSFAGGGPVDFAMAPAGGAMKSFDLHIHNGAETAVFPGVMAPNEVASAMQKFAMQSARASAGRKPRWR